MVQVSREAGVWFPHGSMSFIWLNLKAVIFNVPFINYFYINMLLCIDSCVGLFYTPDNVQSFMLILLCLLRSFKLEIRFLELDFLCCPMLLLACITSIYAM